MTEIAKGDVVWVDLDPVKGREQAGRRPAVVVSGYDYNRSIPNVVIVVPVTTRDRNLPHHIELTGPTGLERVSFAMPEQPRTIDRSRIATTSGRIDAATGRAIDMWLRDFLALETQK